MSATNKTSKLGLPQFIATDKPTWLGDVNGAMKSIDDKVATFVELRDETMGELLYSTSKNNFIAEIDLDKPAVQYDRLLLLGTYTSSYNTFEGPIQVIGEWYNNDTDSCRNIVMKVSEISPDAAEKTEIQDIWYLESPIQLKLRSSASWEGPVGDPTVSSDSDPTSSRIAINRVIGYKAI